MIAQYRPALGVHGPPSVVWRVETRGEHLGRGAIAPGWVQRKGLTLQAGVTHTSTLFHARDPGGALKGTTGCTSFCGEGVRVEAVALCAIGRAKFPNRVVTGQVGRPVNVVNDLSIR